MIEDKNTVDLYNRNPNSQPNVPSLKKYATLSPYLSEIEVNPAYI